MNEFNKLTPLQKEQIEKHLDLVIQANEKINLTRIDDREKALLLHVEDSLCGLKELNDSPEGLYGDLGSGAGYPGIPLSIASGRKTILIDSRQKKMVVVDEIIEKLGLTQQVSTFAGRAELLAKSKAQSFSVLTARALSKLSVIMELASPLLVKGGHLICYKAHTDEEELSQAKRAQKDTGMQLISERSFTLGDEYQRQIVVFKKASTPKIKLPRREGEAQRNPLG